MATKIVENITGSDVELKDMGITIAAGGTYDLALKAKEVVANSDDLVAQIGTGNLVVQKDPGADPITYYDMSEAIRALMDFHESMPKSGDAYKLAVHQSSKPARLDSPHPYNTHWTGSGDDVVGHVLGGGALAQIQCTTGTAESTQDILFDPLFGKVYILHGYIGYDNAGLGDYFNVTAIASATALQQVVDLDYEMDGNKVKFAAGGEGTGTHGLAASPTLVPNMTCAGYWDYNEDDGLTPSLDQTGCYDIYDIDVETDRFVNKLPAFGNNHVTMSLEASDYALLAPGYFLRLKAVNTSDTNWTIWFSMEMYRERSVNADF